MLEFEKDGAHWPNRSASRLLEVAGVRWHVQTSGRGPVLLLLHGTGASSHSYRDLVPLLEDRFTIVVPDLPGHAFSHLLAHQPLSLPFMAKAVAALLDHLALRPSIVAGHSAGAAIALRASLDGTLPASSILSINGALLPFGGAASTFFSPVAKLLVAQPFVPLFLTWRAQSRAAVEGVLEGTGSHLSAAGVDYYAQLFRDKDHVTSTLDMMANWDLAPLVSALPRLATPLLLIAAENDKAVLPRDAERIAAKVKTARRTLLPGLGHLAHEERPDLFAKIIVDAAAQI